MTKSRTHKSLKEEDTMRYFEIAKPMTDTSSTATTQAMPRQSPNSRNRSDQTELRELSHPLPLDGAAIPPGLPNCFPGPSGADTERVKS